MTTATVHGSTRIARAPRAARMPKVMLSLAATGSSIARAFRAAQDLERAATPQQRRTVAETFLAGRTI